MFAWATDERNITALKAISPKKGSQPLLPNIPREDSATEEKIALILNEAQQAMQMKKAIEQHQVANAMVTSMYHQEMQRLNSVTSSQRPSSTSSAGAMPHQAHRHHSAHRKSLDGERHRRNSSNSVQENESSSKEMVERIYKQELIKLAQAAESAGNIAACTLYQQELARLAENSQLCRDGREPGELLTRNMARSPEGTSIKTEPPDSTSDEIALQILNNGPIDLSNKHNSAPTTPTSAGSDKAGNESANHAGSAFLLVRPRMNGHDGYDPTQFGACPPSECLSPLQRMQNIANSLINRPNMSTPTAKPLKAVLPPITQDQFDKYSNVGTEELVKLVKETLSQYSISQRLFGENVLGLSQGSVSDLLARPKPWHMLTQKGREPFIRMQIFLQDAEAIPKLVASQYHIPPDKLMRKTPTLPEQASPREKSSNQSKPTSTPAPPTPTDTHHHRHFNLNHAHHNQHPQLHHLHPHPHPHSHPHLQPFPNHHSWATFSYPSSMLEVVAMTSEIDTLELTSRVKDVLQFHNLGQKLFGEAVLGLSQGSVSELLSKPKPWHMLSIKGREPFIKMHLWLSDPNNVERLKHFQNELKAHRRRRSSLDDRGYESPVLPKRPRVFFTEEQKERLRSAYAHDPYPNQSTIEALANELGVGVKTVINWFHNHRMRAKQQQHSGSSSGSNNDDYGLLSVKSEPNDEEVSNHSDVSSLSGDTSQLQNSFRSTDTSQWMFPQFEPAARNSNMKNESESNVRSPSITKDRNEKTKDTDEDCAFNEEEQESNIDIQNRHSPSPIHTVQPTTLPPGVNKRKRSNPQYVSEGRQLDRTKTLKFSGNDDGSIKGDDEDDEDINDDISVSEDDDNEEKENRIEKNIDVVDFGKESSSDSFRDVKIRKLQEAIETADEGWDEFDRSASIEKIQKNLETSDEEDDWEF
ncbi:hypothetical protein ScPMuIL_006225 [Solemya velum]